MTHDLILEGSDTVEVLIFDWDGTISESSAGITRCVQYALHTVGIEEPDLRKLTHFIGPPLNVEFKRTYSLTDSQVQDAVRAFRLRYDTKGMYECHLYPGMKQFLRDARLHGKMLAIASSKPEPTLKKLIPYLGLDDYFVVACGSDPRDELENKSGIDAKAHVIHRTAHQIIDIYPSLNTDQMAMIGDTAYDMLGAPANHLQHVAVSYGFGSLESLRSTGVSHIASTVDDLRKFLLT